MSKTSRMRRVRTDRGWSLSDAEFAGELKDARVDRKTIWRIEQGLVKARLSTIIRLAKAYGVSSRRLWKLAQADWADHVREREAEEPVA